MLSRKTVLILGAGSSVEFGLPAGPQLADTIGKKVNFYLDAGWLRSGDEDLWASLRNHGPDLSQRYLKAGRLISHGLPLSHSIDDFLYIHGEDESILTVGKSAIALSILDAERTSRLYNASSDELNNFHALADTWAYKIFKYLWTSVRFSHIEDVFSNLTIINFNYDRCVERFLHVAIQVAYSVDSAIAATIVSQLRIFHPYGQVGRLPWQPPSTQSVDYGALARNVDPTAIAKQIKTLTEQSHDPKDVYRWKYAISAADQIVFLGFAFHRQNTELLRIDQKPNGPWPMAYATAYNTSAPDTLVFRDRIQPIRGNPVAGVSLPEIQRKTCAEFLDEYGLTILS